MNQSDNLDARVLRQDWDEFDDWGQSPGGFSVHPDYNAHARFVQEQLKSNTPIYTLKPVGQPYMCNVSYELFKQMQANQNGVWCA